MMSGLGKGVNYLIHIRLLGAKKGNQHLDIVYWMVLEKDFWLIPLWLMPELKLPLNCFQIKAIR